MTDRFTSTMPTDAIRVIPKADRRKSDSPRTGSIERRCLHQPHAAREEVARRAFELYCQEGCPHGRELDHWLQAERELARSPFESTS